MKPLILLSLISFLLVGFVAGQQNVSRIDGFLEIYHPLDETSLFIGEGSGYQLGIGGTLNTCIGHRSGSHHTTGDGNTFVGYASGRESTVGNFNTYVGMSAASRNVSGSGNTCIGASSGRFITGSNNICIGFGAGPSEASAGISNHLFIDNAVTDFPLISGDFVNNTIVVNGTFRVHSGKIFAPNITNIGDHKNMQFNSTTGEIGWDNSSRRYKINITTLQDDWSKILKTRPVKYSRPNSPDYWEYGYIAEEMDSIGLGNLVGYDDQGIPDDVKYDRMVIYLTEVIKGQVEEIRQLKQENREITNRMAEIESVLTGTGSTPRLEVPQKLTKQIERDLQPKEHSQ